MTTAAPAFPGSRPPAKRRTFVKAGLALLLLATLGWIGFVAYQYQTSGTPLSDAPGIRNLKPLARMLQEPPRYAGTIGNVAKPLGTAVGPDGKVYVTESDGDRSIRVFDAKLKSVATLAPPATDALPIPAYIAISPSGEAYVSDRGSNTIYVFGRNGELVRQMDSAPGMDSWQPLALAFDRAGNLYVTESTPDQQRVLVLSPAGEIVRDIRAPQPGFAWANGIAVDSEGRVYVADSNNSRLLVFDKSGAVVATIGSGSGRGDLGMPRGVAVDSENHLLFVVDTSGGKVQVYDISGSAPKWIQSFGGDDMGLNALVFPNGIALGPDRHIYVTDRGNNRVQVWTY